MAAKYYYKKNRMALGPYPLNRMRDLVQQAEIGAAHQISGDGGATWKAAEEFPELFEYEEPPPPPPPPEPFLPPPEPIVDAWPEVVPNEEDESPRIIERRPRRKPGRRSTARRPAKSVKSAPSNPFAIGGFICSLVAAILLAIPCLVWVFIAQSFFWIFNIVIPLGVLAVLGLTLSLIGLRTTRSSMATAGTVLGVIALMMTVMAVVGSVTIRQRMATLRRVQIDSAAADIELKRKDLGEALADFRNLRQDDDESDEQYQIKELIVLKAVAAQLRDLADNHDKHLSATAGTSEFRQAFEEGLPLLRKSVLEVQRAAEQKGLVLQDVLPAVNADSGQLKLLMDTLSLYEKGRLTLQQVEGKMTGK
jgi:hypothetical protein